MTTGDRTTTDDFRAAVRRRWDVAHRPPLRDLAPPGASLATLAELAHADQVEGWRRGSGRSLEEYLAEFPELGADRDSFLLLAYGELELRAARGLPAGPDDMRRRFPAWASDIDHLWEVFAALSAPAPDVAPPGYTCVRRIRRLTQGIDFEAVQHGLERPVMLRWIDPMPAADPGAFLAHARHVSKLDHPDLLPIYDTGRAGSAAFVATQLLAGVTLAERLSAGPLPARDAARMAATVTRGVAHCTARGLVVGRVSPENVFVTRSGYRYLSLALDRATSGEPVVPDAAERIVRLYTDAVDPAGGEVRLPASLAGALQRRPGASHRGPFLARLAAVFDELASDDRTH